MKTFLKDAPTILSQYYDEQTVKTILQKTNIRFGQLKVENKKDSPALKKHTFQRIYPSIALYETLQNYEKPARALEIFEECFLVQVYQAATQIKRLVSFCGIYKITPWIFRQAMPKMFGSKAGFVTDYDDQKKSEFIANLKVCPYYQTCCRYHCPEVCSTFCLSDDLCYQEMHPTLIWGRTKTIARGGDFCDFKLTYQKAKK